MALTLSKWCRWSRRSSGAWRWGTAAGGAPGLFRGTLSSLGCNLRCPKLWPKCIFWNAHIAIYIIVLFVQLIPFYKLCMQQLTKHKKTTEQKYVMSENTQTKISSNSRGGKNNKQRSEAEREKDLGFSRWVAIFKIQFFDLFW